MFKHEYINASGQYIVLLVAPYKMEVHLKNGKWFFASKIERHQVLFDRG
jgi:hypothetical protein